MHFRKPEILTQLASLRETRPEHFWAGVAVTTLSLFGVVTAFAVAPNTAQIAVEQKTVVEQLDLPKTVQPADAEFVHQERVRRGDTVASLMARLGVEDVEAVTFLRSSPDAALVSRQLAPGKSVTARTTARGEFLSLLFPLNGSDRELLIEKRGTEFKVKQQDIPTETRILMRSGEIRSSLFAASDAAGLPDTAAMQMADIFGSDIDFNSDLRKGDRFAVVFEMVYSRGEPLRAGRVLAADFTNDGHAYKAMYFKTADGKGGYYDAAGKPLRKAFLRSPLEFSRVTSGFTSARFHPVLQKWKAHKGVDFGAPIGTKVKATADGVVEFVGRQTGYGNFIVLKHQGTFSTAYGHLKGFATGLRRGARVHQGDVIAYVGMTGWTTGPHLHYEFRVSGNQVNPMTVALPTAIPLPKGELAAFKAATATLQAQLDQARSMTVAMAN